MLKKSFIIHLQLIFTYHDLTTKNYTNHRENTDLFLLTKTNLIISHQYFPTITLAYTKWSLEMLLETSHML